MICSDLHLNDTEIIQILVFLKKVEQDAAEYEESRRQKRRIHSVRLARAFVQVTAKRWYDPHMWMGQIAHLSPSSPEFIYRRFLEYNKKGFFLPEEADALKYSILRLRQVIENRKQEFKDQYELVRPQHGNH